MNGDVSSNGNKCRSCQKRPGTDESCKPTSSVRFEKQPAFRAPSESWDRSPSRPQPAAERRFHAGDVIEARYKGEAKWFPGKIASANDDGTYDVRYEDGDAESRVSEELIRARVKVAAVEPGGSFGDDSLMHDLRRSSTATAAGRCAGATRRCRRRGSSRSSRSRSS